MELANITKTLENASLSPSQGCCVAPEGGSGVQAATTETPVSTLDPPSNRIKHNEAGVTLVNSYTIPACSHISPSKYEINITN